MFMLRNADPGVVAAACAALAWPTDRIANLLADPEGPGLSFDVAFDLAWQHGGVRATSWERRDAAAVLSRFGLPLTPDDPPKSFDEPLVVVTPAPDPDVAEELRSGPIAVARELADAGLREAAIAHALVDDFYVSPSLAAEAAAIAITDPHLAD